MKLALHALPWLLAAMPAAADVPIQVLHSQLTPVSGHQGVPYQDGPGVLLDSEAADDFVVPTDQVWAVTEVEIKGFVLPESEGPPDAVAVAFYADGGDKPGTLVCDYPPIAPASSSTSVEDGSQNLDLELPHSCTLCAGTHFWIALQAVDESGSYFWRQRTVANASPAVWRNPADGYGSGCTDWAAAAGVCHQGDGVSPELSFALRGRPLTPGHVKGDFNGDLCTDVVFQQEASSNVKVWTMSGRARLSETALCATPGPEWQVVGADDFNGDELADVVLRNLTTGEVFFQFTGVPCDVDPVPLTEETGSCTNRPPPPVQPPLDLRFEATGDMNHDGHPDLVLRSESTGKVELWPLSGTARGGCPFSPSPDGTGTPGNWEIKAAMDWNGDGLSDLLWRNRDSGKLVTWFLNAASARISGDFTVPPQPASGGVEWKVLAAGDYGIGPQETPSGPEPVCSSNDILWQNDVSAKTVIWYFDFDRRKTGGEYTLPDGPGLTPRWNVVGPR